MSLPVLIQKPAHFLMLVFVALVFVIVVMP